MTSLDAGGTRRGFRAWLDLVATVMVIAVAAGLLYRMVVPATARAIRPAASAARAEPPLPSEPVSLEHAALKGDPAAPVAIVAFSDFQCPYCRVFAQDTWPALQKALVDTGKVQFAFRHLPLDSIHPQARRIAAGAECARQLGRFWDFHDSLFSRQKELGSADLSALAVDLGISKPAFDSCVAGDGPAALVQADSRSASALGVAGTPTFLVGRVGDDGRVRVTHRLVGAQSVDEFTAAVASASGR